MINNKRIILCALLIALFIMAVGYSAFASKLTLNGVAEIVGEWDVKIIGIEAQNVSKDSDAGSPEFTDTTVSFDAKLAKPGDSIDYVITIKNAGNLDAKLDEILFISDEVNGSPAIIYSTTNLSDILSAGETTTITVKVKYDPNCTETPSVKTKTIKGTIKYVQNI